MFVSNLIIVKNCQTRDTAPLLNHQILCNMAIDFDLCWQNSRKVTLFWYATHHVNLHFLNWIVIAATALLLALVSAWHVCHSQMTGYFGIYIYISNTWSCCNCMNDHHAATAWSCWIAALFHWSSVIMLQQHEWSSCNCMIMLQLHWLIYLFTKLWGAMCSVINCFGLDQDYN